MPRFPRTITFFHYLLLISLLSIFNRYNVHFIIKFSSCFINSFRHAGLRSFANAEEEIEFENEDDTLSEWITQFNTPHTFTPEDLQNYVEIDENLVTTISLTDEEILNGVTKGEEEQKEDEEEAQPDEVVIPSIQQALDAAKLLEKYLLFHEDDPKLSQNMGEIHRKIQKQYWQNKKVQTKMTDYLK
ncbi:hypothetical protein QTP88_002456 [Uroleucon formosanum]